MTTLMLADWTKDMWGALLGIFSFIPNWAWLIIVFTICLKLILSPLDFWQRKLGRDNSKKMAALQPEMEKIRKRYGNNRMLLNQKTQELYKRENYRMGGSCLGMLLTLGLTMFIFITLWWGLMGTSKDQIRIQYETLEKTYDDYVTEHSIDTDDIWSTAYNEAVAELGEGASESEIYNLALKKFSSNEQIKEAQKAVFDKYENGGVKQNFLWIKNIWSPDTATSAFKDYNGFVSSSDFYNTSEAYKEAIKDKTAEQIKEIKAEFGKKYDVVTFSLQSYYQNTWNGYFILAVLAGGVTFLSMWVSQKQTTKKKKEQEQNSLNPMAAGGGAMKIMKFILPILMVFFTITYSAVFALYIITNSLMAMLISFVSLKILEAIDDKKKTETPNGTGSMQFERQNKYRPAYSRENMIVETTADKVEEGRKVVTSLPKQKQMTYRQDFSSQKPNMQKNNKKKH